MRLIGSSILWRMSLRLRTMRSHPSRSLALQTTLILTAFFTVLRQSVRSQETTCCTLSLPPPTISLTLFLSFSITRSTTRIHAVMPQELVFKPYDRVAIVSIIESRLKELAPSSSGHLVQVKALELLARKVAKVGGDIRDAIDICGCVCVCVLQSVCAAFLPSHAHALLSLSLSLSLPPFLPRAVDSSDAPRRSSGRIFSTPRRKTQLSRRARWRRNCASPLATRCTSA